MLYIDYLLSDAEREALLARNVEFSELSLGNVAYHRHGIAFAETEADAVLEILGLLDEGETEELYTPQGERARGLQLMKLIPFPNTGNPVIWLNNRRRLNENYIRMHQATLRHGLVFRDGFEVVDYLHRPGVLFLNHYCAPNENSREIRSGDVRGYRLYVDSLGPNYQVISDSIGEPLAYFRGDGEGGTLWVLFDQREQDDTVLFDYVVHTVARLMHSDLGPPLSLADYRAIASRDRYIGLAASRLQQEIQEIDSIVATGEEEVEMRRRELVSALRSAEAIRCRRRQLISQDPNEVLREFSERLAQEFDALIDSTDLELVNFDEERLTVRTRPIDIRWEGRVYEMGRYDIRVGPRELRIWSSEDPYHDRGHPHPHVTGDDPCLGNLSEGVAKLQASMQLVTLLQLLVRYLEDGYNPADSYRRIEEFDVPSYEEGEQREEVQAVEPAVAAERRPRLRGRRSDSR